MPTQQTKTPRTVQRIEFSTGPPIRNQLLDPEDNPIDLTDATVTISVAFTFPHSGYYRSPRDQIITEQACDIDADQVENIGYVDYTPGTTADVDALTPPGRFSYQYNVTMLDGTVWYWPLTIHARVGGRAFNP